MANNIVSVLVSVQQPPAPSVLQKTGAIISQGATTTTDGTLTLLTQLSDLTSILAAAKSISTMTWSGGVVTVTTTAPHTWATGNTIGIVISGATPSGYNGSYQGTITGASTLTFPLVADPGSVTTVGFVTLADNAELLSQVTTFFAQGTSQAVYVLELGDGDPGDGVTALTAFITANEGLIYSYLVPREWDNVASFLTFLGGFNNTTSKTYFFVTTTVANNTVYSALDKCVFALVEAPGIPATEFSCAAPFYVTLNYDPGSTNRVTPLAFAYVYGVTAYPQRGNQATLTALRAANTNYIGTGAEGGISNTILFWGHLKDGNPFNYWYAIDWAQINLELALANAVINGSNNPLAPLIYNQQGINVLQDVATQVLANGVTYGLLTGDVTQTALPANQFAQNFLNGDYRGQLVINAEPFNIYTAENPNDYAIGKYAGLAGVALVARGFEQIIFSLTATTFA